MILVDTQVLVYAVGGPHELREAARALGAAVDASAVTATTTPDVIQEFTHVYSRRRPRSEAAAHARSWSRLLAPLVAATHDHVPNALRLFERYERLNAFDSLLAAVAIAHGAILVSADRAFAGVPHLRFVELASPELEQLLG